MEITIFGLILLTLTFLIYKTFTLKRHRLPPRPAVALPIIGHLHLLKEPLHRHLHNLSKTTGAIFSLKLGTRLTVIVSSPELVQECFTNKNDIVFANRAQILVDKHIGYNYTTMSGGRYGEHWRSLRRIAAQELLSSGRLKSLLHIRVDEIRRLLMSLHRISELGFSKVNMRTKLSELTFNMMMRTIAGKRYDAEDKDGEQQEVLKLINQTFELALASDPQDFLPFLQLVDYGGYTKKLIELAKKLDKFFQSLVDENRMEKRSTMIGHLLSLQETQPEFYSDLTIKGLILSMLLAGTDTSAVTIEWAMSLLLNHPDIFKKAKEELNSQVGLLRLINEEDLSNLPYLQNIILETFRMFPPAPLLIPHESSEDCKIGGYDIPRGTILLANAWAIQRDPNVWDNPTSFKPERFEGEEVVEPHKLLPFGMGRRACPGTGLAHRIVGLTLGSLIQCFDWERVGLEKVDLDEGIGLTMPKLKPLEVMCRPREIMYKVVQEKKTLLISA